MTNQRREGVLIKPNLQVKVLCEVTDPNRYIVGLLTADQNIGNFKSFYGTQKSRQEAEEIGAGFLPNLPRVNHIRLLYCNQTFFTTKLTRLSTCIILKANMPGIRQRAFCVLTLATYFSQTVLTEWLQATAVCSNTGRGINVQRQIPILL